MSVMPRCQTVSYHLDTQELIDSVCCAWQGIGERNIGLIGIHEVIPLGGWVLSAGRFLSAGCGDGVSPGHCHYVIVQ